MRSGILRHRLPEWIDPAAVYAALFRDADDSFWLDSSDGSGRGWMGTGVRLEPALPGGTALLAAARATLAGTPLLAENRPTPFGLVGWFAYELGADTVTAPGGPHAAGGPPGALLVVDRAIEFDPAARIVDLVALEGTDGDAATRWCADILARLAAIRDPVPPPSAPGPTHATWRDSDASYVAKVEVCKDAIARGDAYQLCLTTSVRAGTAEHPLDIYLRLRASSPTHHGGLLRIGGTALLSSSPEQFLVVGPRGEVSTSPIKGTRPRGASPAEDARLRRELVQSEKEQAENLMIVDLMRNDLARVCELGSVEVPRLFEVESYPHVHQLVSTVRGRLAAGGSAIDALAACFPAGSMTGAPKRSAMTILATLEGSPRGVYSGVFGRLGFDGTADLAMVIRSIVLSDGVATIGAGGGITALSIPAEELAEVKLKAAAPLAALGAS